MEKDEQNCKEDTYSTSLTLILPEITPILNNTLFLNRWDFPVAHFEVNVVNYGPDCFYGFYSKKIYQVV